MVTAGGAETIKLELVVDKASLEKQLAGAFGTPGTGGGETSSRGSRKGKPMFMEAAGKTEKSLGNLTKLVGIGLGIAALVKLSKVMAASTHALQSVLGAIVDSFLAPIVAQLLPGILKLLSTVIPSAAAAGKDVAEAFSVIGKGINKWMDPATTNKEKAGFVGDIFGDAAKIFNPMAMILSRVLPGKAGEAFLTTGQKDSRRESQRRADLGMPELSWLEKHILGPLPSSIAEANLKQFGPLFAGVHTPRQSLERIGGFDSTQMAQFMERQKATQPNFNIQITATDTEGILAELLTKVKDALRDDQSQGVTP